MNELEEEQTQGGCLEISKGYGVVLASHLTWLNKQTPVQDLICFLLAFWLRHLVLLANSALYPSLLL